MRKPPLRRPARQKTPETLGHRMLRHPVLMKMGLKDHVPYKRRKRWVWRDVAGRFHTHKDAGRAR
jgi:hypothetical protein